MTDKDRFTQGYACAIATVVRFHGANTEHEEALLSAGLNSVGKLQLAGVDPYDIEVLKPIIQKINRAIKNSPDTTVVEK